MAEIEYPMDVTQLTIGFVDDFGDDIDGDDPCVETKHTILNGVGYITAEFASGRVFSIHVREVGSHLDG